MSTFNVIPPPYGDLPDDARRQFYDWRTAAFQVLHYELDALTGTGPFPQVHVPWRRSEVIAIRTYNRPTSGPGSGAYTAVVKYYDNAGAPHQIGTVTSLTASGVMVESKPAGTDFPLLDPLSPGARVVVDVSAFAGTPWADVAVDVILVPISR